ncbi:icmt-1 [Symbiodinium sp. CCMP2592]|nr:icmt-1 [Symbiodinium sp. CCMP2592]
MHSPSHQRVSRTRVLLRIRISLSAAAIVLGVAAVLNLQDAAPNLALLQTLGSFFAVLALLATFPWFRREFKCCCMSSGILANAGAILSLLDGHVLISLLYSIGLSNGIVALAVGLPVFIALVAVLIDGLVRLPGHACSFRSSWEVGAAAWLDLDAKSPIPVCCISMSIRACIKATLLAALGGSLVAGLYAALHPKLAKALSPTLGPFLAFAPMPPLAIGALLAWPRGPAELMNLSARARLARWTLVVAAFGSLFIFAAWSGRLLEVHGTWTSCKNVDDECVALASRGDCRQESKQPGRSVASRSRSPVSLRTLSVPLRTESLRYFDYMLLACLWRSNAFCVSLLSASVSARLQRRMAKCRKACRACTDVNWGLAGDLSLAVLTVLVLQTLRFVGGLRPLRGIHCPFWFVVVGVGFQAYCFYESARQLLLADSHLSFGAEWTSDPPELSFHELAEGPGRRGSVQYAIDSQLELAEPLSAASHTTSELNQAHEDAMPIRGTAEPASGKSLAGLFAAPATVKSFKEELVEEGEREPLQALGGHSPASEMGPIEPSSGQDALDDWYSDPWASPGIARKSSSSSRQGDRRGPRKTSGGLRGPEVETFCLEQLDDAPTEVADAAPLEDVSDPGGGPSEPQWQYGRCVALKLVAHSPHGNSAFEQLLPVLLTVFQVSDDERKSSFLARRRQQGSSWWSQVLRCTADKPSSEERDALTR